MCLDSNLNSTPSSTSNHHCAFLSPRYTNATLGQPCITDNTLYLSLASDGSPLRRTILRDNCKAEFYCDSDAKVCELKREVGYQCDEDRQCLTVGPPSTSYAPVFWWLMQYSKQNCDDTTQLCHDPPNAPIKVSTWVVSRLY